MRFGGKEDIDQAGDLGQWFSTWGDCAPPGNLATSWEVLLVFSGYRREILFHILQGTEQPP